jgi:hypothetical protein
MGALWLVVAVSGQVAITQALDGRRTAVVVAATMLAAGLWAATFAALAICSTLSLTIVRLVCPVALVVAGLTAAAGASTAASAVLASAGLGATVIAFSAGAGAAFVQASAYGAEHRFALRPPTVAFVVPVVWVAATGLAVLGVVAMADARWVLAAGMLVVGTAMAAMLGRAAHQLSRRWLVLVPAGIVVHDPVVLADNAMFPRSTLHAVAAVTKRTTALDATGGARGLAIKLAFTDPMSIALAGRRRRPGANVVDASALLVAPTRPGTFLLAAADHRLPTVGGDATS